MTYIYPDFYPAFQCIASGCRHSCCKGWEIDIDEDSFAWYKKMKGPFGERLKNSISSDPAPHFVLGDDEKCPFLREDGLCDMILELGEESLCDICTEHPRFYNEFPDRLEAGLGLCCEEAVRLLLEGTEPLRLIAIQEDDEENSNTETESETTEILRLRDRIFTVLADSSLPLVRKMERSEKLVTGNTASADAGIFSYLDNNAIFPVNLQNAASFYLTLETMDSAWRPMLEQLRTYAGTFEPPEGMQYERLAEYFVYRHFAAGETEKEQRLRLRFCFLSTIMICALKQTTKADLHEIIRLYSSEIEYSDENVDAALRYLDEQRNALSG